MTNADDAPAMPAVGNPAPALTLPDQNGKIHSLKDFQNSWVLLYFYPKDDTPGCTTEACGLRDSFAELKKRNCIVLGVSTDTADSHKKFVEKYDLPFTLLADPEGKITAAYGVRRWKSFMGKTALGTIRASFLIDPQGRIAKMYPKVSPEQHAAEILQDIDEFMKM